MEFSFFFSSLKNVLGCRGGIRTHASLETGALNQRLRPHSATHQGGELFVVVLFHIVLLSIKINYF